MADVNLVPPPLTLPPTTNIMRPDLTTIGAFPISAQDKALLASNGTVTLTFHTPRMLAQSLGPRNFSIVLRQDLSGNIICDDAPSVNRAIAHIAEILNTFNSMNATIKNINPDPNRG